MPLLVKLPLMVSEDENGVKAKERVVWKVESIFKKPHRAAGKLTLSERKWKETSVQNELLWYSTTAEEVDGGPRVAAVAERDGREEFLRAMWVLSKVCS